ncbi:MAG TPA: hypothetical protein VF158_07155 [Longimicrobiales bacterium]
MRRRRRAFEDEEWERAPARGAERQAWAPRRRRRRRRGGRDVARGAAAWRGEWQRRGHGPAASGGYGWEFRGGAPRGEHLTWPETVPVRGMGGRRLQAELRGGGLPRGAERFEAEGDWTPGEPPRRSRGPAPPHRRGRLRERSWRYRPRRAGGRGRYRG